MHGRKKGRGAYRRQYVGKIFPRLHVVRESSVMNALPTSALPNPNPWGELTIVHDSRGDHLEPSPNPLAEGMLDER